MGNREWGKQYVEKIIRLNHNGKYELKNSLLID